MFKKFLLISLITLLGFSAFAAKVESEVMVFSNTVNYAGTQTNTFIWTGVVDGDFANSLNWSSWLLPDSHSIVLITDNPAPANYPASGTCNAYLTIFRGVAYNNGTIIGNTVFYDGSYNGAAGDLYGSAVFYNFSYNSGTNTGNAVFNDESYNSGTNNGNAIFNGITYNSGTITSNVIFNNSSYNSGVVNGDVIWNDFAYDSSGTVTGTNHYGAVVRGLVLLPGSATGTNMIILNLEVLSTNWLAIWMEGAPYTNWAIEVKTTP